MNVKRIVTLALAAALILSLSVTAYAVKTSVASPEAAQKVALQEIEVWKQMGLISSDIAFEGEANQIIEKASHIENFEIADLKNEKKDSRASQSKASGINWKD